MVKDIFDEVADEPKTDVFDSVESTEDTSIESIKNQLSAVLEKFDAKDRKRDANKISAEVKAMVKAEIAKIKPVQNVIEKTIEKQVIKNIHIPVELPAAPPPPKVKPQIIREVRVEVQKEDNKTYAEEQTVEELKKEIELLKKELKDTQDTLPFMMGGSGVIGIPPPEGNEAKVLTVKGNKATWQTATGSGGSSTDIYTTANVTTTRTLNPTTSTIDNLYNVLASLIVSLQGAGIIQ